MTRRRFVHLAAIGVHAVARPADVDQLMTCRILGGVDLQRDEGRARFKRSVRDAAQRPLA